MIAAVSPPKHTAVFIHATTPFSFPLHLGADPGKMIWIRKRMNFFRCFNKRTGSKELKVKVDSGGEDLMDAGAAKARVSPQHLVIMVNGIIGSSADWRYAAEQFVKKLPDKIIVHRSECNHSKLTFDGVDLMGDRLAEEVLEVVRHRPEVRKISFVAHSLGGLVARYAIAKLYENLPKSALSNLSANSLNEEHTNSLHCLEQPCEARIAGLEPVNFITFATPHLGSRGNKQLPFLCGLPFLERRASQTAHLIVGRTGKHLFLTDNDNEIPLLLQMVNDSDELRFISALRAFKRRVVYANANYDHVVGWRTSSIRRQNELPKVLYFFPPLNSSLFARCLFRDAFPFPCIYIYIYIYIDKTNSSVFSIFISSPILS
ncbi:ALPHA/BETA-HYDROLASES SUPERFAMILY PROTEIN [Salix purpurea]|uniref:ALPHA/BETA-HYDROLASES SUPERFAMILY PROTEIN n=1 Tax=Salix purpurea TaxID=77065 RepID=A0A9Q0ZEN5_SALPP|nr:ALPHA/BETA-HYDROLASES SUPERFAMILY PROTEIN [Salix purpurea]